MRSSSSTICGSTRVIRPIFNASLATDAASHREAIGEVRRFDDERVALPVTPRIAHQPPDRAAEMRPPVERTTRFVHPHGR